MTTISTVVDRTVSLRAMRARDLDLGRGWLSEPHVAWWYLTGSTVEAEVEELRR